MDWSVGLTAISFFLACAVVMWALVELLRVILKHRQRMAMIARGMHPDQYTRHGDRPPGTPGVPAPDPAPSNG